MQSVPMLNAKCIPGPKEMARPKEGEALGLRSHSAAGPGIEFCILAFSPTLPPNPSCARDGTPCFLHARQTLATKLHPSHDFPFF